MLVDALAIVLAWLLVVLVLVIRFVLVMVLVRHLVIRLNFSSFGLSSRTHRYLCADPNCHRANPND